ncbi:83_t:CDS:2 [Cetraspora pellucida]|uniref:83_t:CDS:1 n=1 Tax=Cetraspora pellucida TaxID=1433469 RepID=A0A9N9EAF3_9GLOM|nr:83_t:CDS:2 [Cetraspora pellucida]
MPSCARLNNRKDIKINEYNALNNVYNEIELDNNEWINDVLSDNITSEEFNEEASSKDSISDEALSKDEDSIEELNYENSSEISNNSEIISEESNDCIMNEEGPDKIVDKSLSRKQMLSISGEFTPYFNNITETLMFCWVEKHNICGVYIQIGNFLFDKRRQLRNHFVLGFVMFGGKFDEFIEPFVAEMKQLEKGKIMDVEGSECLVIASLGDVTADLPQGNDLAGVKRHEATKGCHTCNATKDSWTSDNINLSLISHYHHITNIQFGEISAAPTITRCKEIAAECGLPFKHSFLENDYIKLRECLDNERKLLSQAFKDFENLPNLHVNFHLVQHARNYATLLNTSVGMKEMVHHIFKNIVTRTNRKNIDLDLLKHYTTLFAIHYLFDGGVDSCFFSSNNALMNFSYHLKQLVNNWFITEKFFDTNENLHEELILAYRDMDYELTMFEDSCQFYEYICFLVEDNDTIIQYRLHVSEVVTVITENNSQNFAILKSIFSHQKSNQCFAFIIVDWFEITNQTKVGCPIYKLRIENEGQ